MSESATARNSPGNSTSTAAAAAGAEAGRYAYDGLDRILHEKARLGIMASLIGHPEGLLFNELKSLCSLTDGNLSRHLEVLREKGLIVIHKDFADRRPQTTCVLTALGLHRFQEYLQELTKVIDDARFRSADNARLAETEVGAETGAGAGMPKAGNGPRLITPPTGWSPI